MDGATACARGSVLEARGKYLMLIVALALALSAAAPSIASAITPPLGPEGKTWLGAGSPGSTQPDASGSDVGSFERVPGHYIVVLEGSIDHPGAVAETQAEQRDGDLGFIYRSAIKGYSVAGLSRTDVEALRNDPRVRSVTPDGRVEGVAQTTPFGISRIFATENASLDIDGVDDVRVDVDVAIIDSGTDYTHPDLNVVARTNCIPLNEKSAGGSCVDNSGVEGEHLHGTHTGGTVGAIDNGSGVVGVAPGARLWSVRVLGKANTGEWSWVIAGVDWITSHASDIEVVNMSVAGYGPVPALEEAITKSVEKGIVYAAASGNDATNTAPIVPANHPDVISVSGIADYDGKPGGEKSSTCANRGVDDGSYVDSDWGSVVDITAPAVCILSTIPGNEYASLWGTSMAAPHVAGAAAVLASKSNPNSKADVEAIRQALIDGGSLAWTDYSEDTEVEPLLYLDDQPITKTEVATGAWSTSGEESAKLYGALNPRGLETSYQFEYGTTIGYGQSAPASAKKLSSGTKYTTVSETVSNLKFGQAYHYRLIATNSSGTTYGADRTFVASRWANQIPATGPSNPTSEWLEDISCPSSDCMAVGSYFEGSKYATAYRLSNDQWSFGALPIPKDGVYVNALGVSCSSASACTAVGSYAAVPGSKIVPYAARWDGTSWQTQTVPLPYSNAPYSQLNDVSCTNSSECVAAGYYKNPEGIFVNYAVRWKNGEWTSLLPPNLPSITQSILEDVSCTSSSFCIGVGYSNLTSGTSTPVIVAWNGSSWSLHSPARTGYGWLSGVTCTSSSSCVAVGGGGESPVEAWNGSKWAIQSVESSGGSGYFNSVSCASTNDCAAVGYIWGYTGYSAYVQNWNGTSWEVETAPREDEGRDLLRGVSCTGLWGCTLVGESHEAAAKKVIFHRVDAVTGQASNLTPSQASLNGTINPGGLSTAFRFEYGTTAGYGAEAPIPAGNAGSGSKAIDVSQVVAELQPETKYHYRLVASNASGTQYGKDKTFRSGTPPHQFQFSYGSQGTGAGQFSYPMGVAVDPSGNVWVADSENNRVQKFNAKGEFLLQFGSKGSGNGQFKKPIDIAATSNGDVWVTDSENYRVQKFNSNGAYLAQFGSYGVNENGKFTLSFGIAIGPNGHIWVSDRSYYRVEEFTANGEFVRSVGKGYGGAPLEFLHPAGVAVDQEGNVWIADQGNNRVQKISSGGAYLGQFGGFGNGDGQLNQPTAVDVKASGDILVAERGSSRVQQFSSAGEYVSKFDLGGNPEPYGIATTPNGTVYVSNNRGHRVERWQQAVPDAVTQAPSKITAAGATLAGIVNPRGVATTYRFEYGKTTAYGGKAPVPNESAGSGTADVAVTKAISGLEADTTYHFRIVAANANGTVYGKDEAFTTENLVASRLSAMAVTEQFDGSSASLARFSADWSTLGWAGGSSPKGEDSSTGWRPLDAYPSVSGAFYKSTVTDTGPGTAAVATMAVNPGVASRYFSLWLDASGSSGTRTGYELRFTNVSGNIYDVALSKWQAGTQTTLASKLAYSFANGNSFAVADEGGTVSAWTNTGSGFKQLVSASDASFSAGNAGVEGSGNITRLTNFKVGSLLASVANMDGALKNLALNDLFGTYEEPLSGGGAWAALAWDNSTSGHNTGWVSVGWGPYDAYPTINGAYWTKASAPDTGAGVGVAATLYYNPSIASRYFSLWLDMPSPASARTGYELRFTEVFSNAYQVALSKWQAGSKTALFTVPVYSLAIGSQVALVDKGGTVSIWTKSGSEYFQLLSVGDTAFNAGYTGIEGAGNITRLKDFRSGPLPPF